MVLGAGGTRVRSPCSPSVEGLADHSSGPTATATIAALTRCMAAEGIKPKLKVLYVPDYMSTHRRLDFSGSLYRELSRMLPSYEISIGLADGPFEDDQGTSSHSDKDALAHKQVQRQILATKVDFHASIVKLARHAAMHLPQVIICEGQGGLIAAGCARPGVVEAAFTTRNVQQREVYQLAAA